MWHIMAQEAMSYRVKCGISKHKKPHIAKRLNTNYLYKGHGKGNKTGGKKASTKNITKKIHPCPTAKTTEFDNFAARKTNHN